MTKPSSRMALGWPFLQLIPRQYFLTGPWWLEVMGSCSSTRWDIIFYQCVWYGLPDRTDLSPITIWLVKSIEWKLTIVTMNISPFDHLKNNLTQQSGEKSNKCYQCDYASSWAAALATHLKTHSGEKPNKCNQCDYASSQAGNLRAHLKTQWGKVNQIQSMWLCIVLCKLFEGSFENAQRWKVIQMQPVWLCNLLYKCFEGTFENTQWRKTK